MIYKEYTVGGELMHSAKGTTWAGAKYIDKVRTKTGKWRYIYDKKVSGKSNRARRNKLMDEGIRDTMYHVGNYMRTGQKDENYDRYEEHSRKNNETIDRLDKEYEQTVAGKAEKAKEKASNAIQELLSKIEEKRRNKKK